MSPSGKARPDPGAGDASSLASPHFDDKDKQGSLPLRLSVARGGLGLELTAPASIGALLVEQLEVELPGLSYPLDLSKGVKQFRNRRSVLRHASLRLDTQKLSRLWANELLKVWGPGVEVRIRPVFEDSTRRQAEGAPRNDEVSEGVPSLAVTVHAGRRALAFDLLVLSGSSPRIALDAARAVGHDEPPLLLCMQALDALLRAAAGGVPGGAVSLKRTGRAIQLGGLAESIALWVLPSLGCRLPQVDDQVITSVEHRAGEIHLVLGRRGEPFSAGRRALWVAGTAELLRFADESLGQADLARARALYLEALERAPGHPEALLSLSEMDLAAGDRGEAALSFLQELDAIEGARFASISSARRNLALSRALRATGRLELVRETQAKALADEGDAVVQALLGLELAEREPDLALKRARLDVAVSRAPFLKELRFARFELALAMGDFRTATGDAEHLEASETLSLTRAHVCQRVGSAFRAIARRDDALRWYRRALRLAPDDPEVMLRLAECLLEGGENLRAAELLQASIRRLTEAEPPDDVASAEGGGASPNPERVEMVREMLSEARLILGRLLLGEDFGDVPSALAHLCAVETRSHVGAAARLMEAEIHHERRQFSARDRALSRLLEAAEMRWIDLGPQAKALVSLLESWESTIEPSFLEQARRLAVSLDAWS